MKKVYVIIRATTIDGVGPFKEIVPDGLSLNLEYAERMTAQLNNSNDDPDVKYDMEIHNLFS